MNEKREWYQAELLSHAGGMWVKAIANDGSFETAAAIARGDYFSDLKARIVKHTTEVVEEHEATKF